VFSIVTPCLNQSAFVEAALQSVAIQNVEVEHIVRDGGSTDGSVDVIRAHSAHRLAWTSEPDDGQYDALQKGFDASSGELMGWLNADDFYVPGALQVVESVFAQHPEIEWLTTTVGAIANADGGIVRTLSLTRYSKDAFYRGFNLPSRGWYAGSFIPQESTFWRRSLWERAGSRLDTSLSHAGDFELWARFYRHAELWCVNALLGVYRSQPAQKTSTVMGDYLDEAEQVLRAAGGRPYSERESRRRTRAARWITGNRLWRLPTDVRRRLEDRGLIYRTPELLWDFDRGRWMLNTRYFV
jgi:glycosyltransferase involved in cell wall biosynthesis